MREAREDGGDRRARKREWNREWNREWRCFFCGKNARWRTSEGKPLCDFAAKAWVECFPWIPVRMTYEEVDRAT